jgi:hypothetical protein
MKNSASTFRGQEAQKQLRYLQIALDAKTQVWSNVSDALFVEFVPAPPGHEK